MKFSVLPPNWLRTGCNKTSLVFLQGLSLVNKRAPAKGQALHTLLMVSFSPCPQVVLAGFHHCPPYQASSAQISGTLFNIQSPDNAKWTSHRKSVTILMEINIPMGVSLQPKFSQSRRLNKFQPNTKAEDKKVSSYKNDTAGKAPN